MAGSALRSGSKVLLKDRLKVFKPAKPDNTINRAAEPMTMTRKVIKLMMFTALCLLLERTYRRAMYKGKFKA